MWIPAERENESCASTSLSSMQLLLWTRQRYWTLSRFSLICFLVAVQVWWSDHWSGKAIEVETREEILSFYCCCHDIRVKKRSWNLVEQTEIYNQTRHGLVKTPSLLIFAFLQHLFFYVVFCLRFLIWIHCICAFVMCFFFTFFCCHSHPRRYYCNQFFFTAVV